MLDLLLAVALELTPYEAPTASPRLAYRSHAWLEARGCPSTPCSIQGLYLDNGVVYLDRALRPISSSVLAQSVLVHELVHFLQDEAGYHRASCEQRNLREQEAYAVQARFLRSHGVLAEVSYTPKACDSGTRASFTKTELDAVKEALSLTTTMVRTTGGTSHREE